jgi:hypothetical protein
MQWIAPFAGALLLLMLSRDVLITVFHPEGHGGPLFRVLSRGVWAGIRGVARRAGGPRQGTILTYAGPLLTVVMPAIWVVILVVGFALLYLPWIMELVEIPGTPGPPWREAVYHSLNASSTLGMGDVHARHTSLRWLTAIQALAGFGLVTAALSYFMGVYRELPVMRTLAAEIRNRLDEANAVQAILSDEQRNDWDQWFEHVARTLIHLRHVFAQYPILHFFRPSPAQDEFLVQLGRLLQLHDQLRAVDEEAIDRSAFRALDRAVAGYMVELNLQFIERSSRLDAAELSYDDIREIHERVLRYLAIEAGD